MRILVCGGRDWTDALEVSRALGALHRKRGISVVIQGGAPGADLLAKRWAHDNGVWCEEYRADWKRLGHAAGPLRNQRMIDEGKPDGVVAFPGGIGTADMIRRAKAAGLTVWEPCR